MFGWIAETTLIAAALAAVALVMGRSRRVSAEARHALWVVVLVKFLLPPVIAWPALDRKADSPVVAGSEVVLPPVALAVVARHDADPVPPDAVEPILGHSEPVLASDLDPITPPEPIPAAPTPPVGLESPRTPVLERASDPIPRVAEDRRPDPPATALVAAGLWSRLILAGWLLGSVVVAGRGLVRVGRFRRVLSQGQSAPSWLVAEVSAVAARFGVKSPRTLVVAGVAAPLLWCLGRPCLVVPEGWDQLTPAARSALIAHELAHLSRRDHWVVRLELLAGLLWWWNPVFRLARRRVRDEAELACDARVVRAFPDGRFVYAESLIAVCARFARPDPPLPALGIGGPRAARTLEARLTMILRDPARPPTRWTPLLALILLALAVPSWTRGQVPQDPVPPSEPPRAEAPRPAAPAADPRPESTPKAKPQPAVVAQPPATWTIPQIRDGMMTRPWPSNALACRYVASRRIKDLAANSTRVEVEVADVILGRGMTPDGTNDLVPQPGDRLGELIRLDILAAGPQANGSVLLSPSPDAISRQRRFTAQTQREGVTFGGMLNRAGPVSIQWLGAYNTSVQDQTDDLADRLTNQPLPDSMNPLGLPSMHPLGRLDMNREQVAAGRLRPTPSSLLDLAGPTRILFFNVITTRMDVVGTDRLDGVETVRVAWTASPANSPEIRGLVWVAPTLGFAVVRLEAVQEKGTTGRRQTWSRTAAKFDQVGAVWLPREVTWNTAVTPAQPNSTGTTTHAMEAGLIATFEDFRVNPPVNAETFHPQFPIEALDPRSGSFTAKPLALPAGLADRLDRAILASPFGPPRAEQPKLASVARSESKPTPPSAVVAAESAGQPAAASAPASNLQQYETFMKQRDEKNLTIQRLRDRIAALSVQDPAILRATKELDELNKQLANLVREQGQPAAVTPGAAPTMSEATLHTAQRATQAAEVARAEAIRDRAQLDLDKNLKLAANKVISPNEVATVRADLKIAEAGVARERARLAEIDAQPEPANNPTPSRSSPAALQAHRAAQVAEVDKFQARLARALLELKNTRALRQQKAVSQQEVDLFEANHAIAQAELARAQAQLAEIDADASATPARSAPALVNPAVLQARRAAQAAEVDKYKAQLARAQADHNRAEVLIKRKAIDQQEYDQIQASDAVAQAELAREQAKLAEADALLAEAKSDRGIAREDLGGDARNLVEIAQVQLDAREIELHQAESHAERKRKNQEIREPLARENRIPQAEWVATQTAASLAQDEVKVRQIAVREAAIRLKQAQRRAESGQARRDSVGSGTLPRTDDPLGGIRTPFTLHNWRDQIAWAEMQVRGKSTRLDRARTQAARAEQEQERIKQEVTRGVVPQTDGERAKATHQQALDDVATASFELEEAEFQLNRAKQHYEAEQVKVKRDVERARDRVEWSRKMRAQGYVSQASFTADVDHYNDLMTQLDPNFKPAPVEPSNPGPSPAPTSSDPPPPPADSPQPEQAP